MERVSVFISFLLPSHHYYYYGEKFSNNWMECSNISGYGRYGFEVVQEGLEVLDSKAGPRLAQFC